MRPYVQANITASISTNINVLKRSPFKFLNINFQVLLGAEKNVACSQPEFVAKFRDLISGCEQATKNDLWENPNFFLFRFLSRILSSYFWLLQMIFGSHMKRFLYLSILFPQFTVAYLYV
jgi:hypothetical protein